MGRPFKLECFDISGVAVTSVESLTDEYLEEERLQAFDNGYQAGWDDSAAAFNEDQRRISGEFANNLQELSFTYHEALNRMSLSLEPMFEGLVRLVLPETLERGFGTRLVEQLCELAGEQIGKPMQVLVPVGQADGVGALVPPGLSPPPKVIED